jgi:hypothetical protein
MPEGFSRKGAKAQSAAAFLRVFLCVFAPLREKCLLSHVKILTPGTFCAKLTCYTEGTKRRIGTKPDFLSVFVPFVRLVPFVITFRDYLL